MYTANSANKANTANTANTLTANTHNTADTVNTANSACTEHGKTGHWKVKERLRLKSRRNMAQDMSANFPKLLKRLKRQNHITK